jgi:hypothetical protein
VTLDEHGADALADIQSSFRRGAARSRAAGLSFSVAVHVAVLTALALGVSRETAPAPTPPVEVQLLRRFAAAAERPAKPKRATPPRRQSPKRTEASPTAPATAVASPPAAQGQQSQTPQGSPPSWPTVDARLREALRASIVGCAHAEAAGLSETEREACRRRLASGAATAPYIPGIPPKKRAYYAALAASEEAMERDPMGGHGAGVICGLGSQNKGFKLGSLPCSLVLSPSPYTPEVDVRPP